MEHKGGEKIEWKMSGGEKENSFFHHQEKIFGLRTFKLPLIRKEMKSSHELSPTARWNSALKKDISTKQLSESGIYQ